MNKAIGFILAFALMIGLTVAYFVVNGAAFDSDDDPSAIVAVIDSEAPGTKVFWHDVLLGETPYALTREKLEELGGLQEEEEEGQDATLKSDAWGETFSFGSDDETELRFMLQAPDAVADRYVSVETPWGRRTRIAGWTGPARGPAGPKMVAHFEAAETPEGFRFRVHVPAAVDAQSHSFVVELTGENRGGKDIVGAKPAFALVWGGVYDSWRERQQLPDLPLPEAWQRIRPGQTVTATYTMNTPVEAGDYSLTATFGHRGQPEKAVSAPSNTALLLVR